MGSTRTERFILLDTMIVAGLFAVSKSSDYDKNVSVEEWKRAVDCLISKAETKKMVVPTSVCFELMSWNQDWFKLVSDNPDDNPIFRYSNKSIDAQVLHTASEYAFRCGAKYGEGNDDNSRYKLKSMDPITAAYCIKGNHYLLTENERDFPESYFHIIGSEILVLKKKDGRKYRRVLYILETNKNK